MGLKMWNVVLVLTLLILVLGLFLAGVISLFDFALLLCSILLFFASYVTLTRKDTFTKVPTPLELEKMKRKRKSDESEIITGPEK